MESYETIMGLVEDVRDILDLHGSEELHEIEGMTKAQRAKVIARIKASHDPAAGHHPDVTQHVRQTLRGIKTGKAHKPGKTPPHDTHAHSRETHGHAGPTKRNPFKNIKAGKRLGPTTKNVAKLRGPSTKTPGKRKKIWRCRCSNYHCLCTGKNAEGEQVIKHVEIKRGYKKGYNQRYKAWRAKHKNIFKAGGKRGFKAPAKSHTKAYHAD